METESWKTIADCIARYIRNELSREQEVRLNEWLEESEANRREFERICSGEFLEEHRKIELSFSKQEAFGRFSHLLHRKRRVLLFRRVGQIAAMVVLLVGIAWWWMPQKENTARGLSDLPGIRAMARLTLADGQSMELKQEQDRVIQQEGVKLHITGGQVICTPDEKKGAPAMNILEIPRRGEFRLALADGTRVWLNAETVLKFPAVFEGSQREVYLEGEAYFEVMPDSLRPFRVVLADGGSVEVLGTAFNIRSYKDEIKTQATLVKGRVAVHWHNKKLHLEPGEQASIDQHTHRLEKYAVNVRPYIAWKEGRLAFRKQRLEEIMHTLERWYDVQVTYETADLKEITFSGNIERYEDFGKIADLLELTGRVKFELTGNRIKIKKSKL